MICSRTTSQTPNSQGSLPIAIKAKAKYMYIVL
jgi:hypothetical protein